MSLRYARANKLLYDKVISLFLVFVFHLYISLYTVFFFKALVLTTLNYLFFSFEFSLQACCNFYMFLHWYIFKADYVSLQHVLIFNISHFSCCFYFCYLSTLVFQSLIYFAAVQVLPDCQKMDLTLLLTQYTRYGESSQQNELFVIT